MIGKFWFKNFEIFQLFFIDIKRESIKALALILFAELGRLFSWHFRPVCRSGF